MKFVFTKHALKDKLPELERFGWKITKIKVKKIVMKPRWRGFQNTEKKQQWI